MVVVIIIIVIVIIVIVIINNSFLKPYFVCACMEEIHEDVTYEIESVLCT